ncbi:hypothetical protein DFH06DRAFT_1340276 [Mycena polygramma]|nr:hypothetical protein DFH06DRAFT_1340276 [Mycena polygramma]
MASKNEVTSVAKWPDIEPTWPAQLTTFEELRAYMVDPTTQAIALCDFNVDFHTPVPGSLAYDESVYTLDEPRTVFVFTIFGKLKQTAIVKDGHRTFFLQGGEELPPDLQRMYARQMQVLSAPRIYDDLTAENMVVDPCTDSNRHTGLGGRFIEVHTDHVGWGQCFFHLREGDGYEKIMSSWKKPFPVETYEILARNLRPLHIVPSAQVDDDIEMPHSPEVTEEASLPQTPGKARGKRSIDTGSSRKRKHSEVDSPSGVVTRSRTKAEAEANESQLASPSREEMRPGEPRPMADKLAVITEAVEQNASRSATPSLSRIDPIARRLFVPPPSFVILTGAMDALPYDVLDEILGHLLESSQAWVMRAWCRTNAALTSRAWQAHIYESPRFWTTITVHRYTREEYIVFCLKQTIATPFTLVLHASPDSVAPRATGTPKTRAVKSRPIPEYIDLLRKLFESRFADVIALDVMARLPSDWQQVMAALYAFDTPGPSRLQGYASREGPLLTRDDDGTAVWTNVRNATLEGVSPSLVSASNLTSLALAHIEPEALYAGDDFLDVLAAASGLRRMRLHEVHCAPPTAPRRIILHHLCDFNIAYVSDDSVNILRYIAMPALRRLWVDAYETASLGAIIVCNRDVIHTAQEVDVFVGRTAADSLCRFLEELSAAIVVDLRRSGLRAITGVNQSVTEGRARLADLKYLTLRAAITDQHAATICRHFGTNDGFIFTASGDQGRQQHVFKEHRIVGMEVVTRTYKGDMDRPSQWERLRFDGLPYKWRK